MINPSQFRVGESNPGHFITVYCFRFFDGGTGGLLFDDDHVAIGRTFFFIGNGGWLGGGRFGNGWLGVASLGTDDSGVADLGVDGSVGLDAPGWMWAATTLAMTLAAAWGLGSSTEQEASPASGLTHHWARGTLGCLDFI